MALTRETLTTSVLQSAIYDTGKHLVLFLVGIGAASLMPQIQELTGATWLGALGWVLLGFVALGFTSVLAYSAYGKSPRLPAGSDDLPLTGKVFVWRTEVLEHDFRSNRPFVDFALDLFDGSLLSITIQAQEAGGYVKVDGTPLPQRLEVLNDVTVGSRSHGRLKVRQWLSREDLLRQAKRRASAESKRFDETFTFPGLPAGASFYFDFSETRIPILAGDKEYPLSFVAASASYYLSQDELQKITSGD